MARLPNFLVIIRSEKLSGKGQGRGAKKRTFRFGKKNVSFPKVETFRFADYTTREKFDDIFNINFFSPVELLRLLVKKKKLHSNSSVVFIVSIGGTGKFSVGHSIYGASKAALQAMVRFCAQELASKKVRVNGINPGMVNTPLIRRGTLTDEQLEEDRAKYPLKRYGEPEDIAYAAIYLLSNASSWVTGQSIIIDGGITSK